MLTNFGEKAPRTLEGLQGATSSLSEALGYRVAPTRPLVGEEWPSAARIASLAFEPIGWRLFGASGLDDAKANSFLASAPDTTWSFEWEDERFATPPDAVGERPREHIFPRFLSEVIMNATDLRRWHHVVREASPYEHAAAERSFDDATWSLSTAAMTDMLKVLNGKSLRPRSQDAQQEQARVRSAWNELQIFLHSAIQVMPVGAVARDGKRMLVDAIRRALARSRSRRVRTPAAPNTLAACAAGSADLGSEIMRHGPPLPPWRPRTLPGAS